MLRVFERCWKIFETTPENCSYQPSITVCRTSFEPALDFLHSQENNPRPITAKKEKKNAFIEKCSSIKMKSVLPGVWIAVIDICKREKEDRTAISNFQIPIPNKTWNLVGSFSPCVRMNYLWSIISAA